MKLFPFRLFLAQVQALLIAQPMLNKHSVWYQDLALKIGKEVHEHLMTCPGCNPE